MSRIEPMYLRRPVSFRSESENTKTADAIQAALQPLADGFAMAAQTAVPMGVNMASSLTGGNMLGLGPISSMMGGLGGGGASSDYAMQMQLLNVQRKMQMEQQVWNTVSNIEKAQHETRMALIRNVRS